MATYVFPTPPWPQVEGVVYGHDWSCRMRTVSLEMPDGSIRTVDIVDVDPFGGEVDGRLGLLESCERRLVTYAGTLINSPNYGRDVRQWLNDDVGPRELAQIASECDEQMLQDERIVSSRAVATLLNSTLMVDVPLFDQRGPFGFTMSVSDVTVAILARGV